MKRWIVMGLVILLLAGCTAAPGTTDTRPTVEDLFIPPIQTVPTTDGVETTNPKPNGPTEPTATEPVLGGGGSAGLAVDMETDENGRKCYEYHGGEMAVSFWVEGNGVFVENGAGFLLFVDGLPQPYRISEDGEYSYMHAFKKEDYSQGEALGNLRLDFTFLFEPIAGKKGDYIECLVVMLKYPDYSPDALGDLGNREYTLIKGGACRGLFVLKYIEDPPVTEPIPVQERLYDLAITKVDTTHAEVSGWTGDDAFKEIRTKAYVNGLDSQFHGNVWDVSKENVITVQFEIWGSPLVQYRLVYFMNNQPVSVADENIIEITVEQGKKTIVTAKLDISDFDKEASLYCILVSRNRMEHGAAAGQASSGAYSYFWLHDDSKP